MADCASLRSAMVHAMKFEISRLATRGQRRAVRIASVQKEEPAPAAPSPSNFRELLCRLEALLRNRRQTRRSFRPECWTCGRTGHLRNGCPKRPTRRDARTVPQPKEPEEQQLVGFQEHIQADCPEAPKVIANITGLQGDKNGLVVLGAINGTPCKMVIDTGADVTLLRPDILERIGVPPHRISAPRRMTLQTATGDSAPVHGQVQLPVSIGSITTSHPVYVADIHDECLLGLDFLRQHGIVVDLQEGLLRSGNEEIPLLNRGHEESSTGVLKVVLAENVIVPARSEAIIPGEVSVDPGALRLAVSEPSHRLPYQGIVVARTLVKPHQNTPVRVVNTSNCSRQLEKGLELCTLEPVSTVIHQPEVSVRSVVKGTKYKLPDHLQKLLADSSQHLQEKQRTQLGDLLLEFQDIFSATSSDYGRTDSVCHRIDTGDHPPVRQPARRLPLAMKEKADQLVKEMRDQNIIEPSSSPWASPVVLVKKKDGTIRFCVDYRRLNDVTRKDSYPIPRIDDTLDSLAGAQWFSTLDLKSGYWQVGLHPDDKEKTAFSTGTGLWQFNVMPFGLCNAPATFERLMENVLRGLSFETCLVYLDDIIVIGRTFSEHLTNLRSVFSRLQTAKLKLSPKKCRLFQKETGYLGHIISSEGVKTDPEKIEAIVNWPVPKDLHQLRSFLGLCSYYRRFMKGFSITARPLHRLTEAQAKFDWTDQCQEAFAKLKWALSSAPVLAFPKPDKPFILDTDASNTGIGAVLSQVQDGHERAIAYFSKTLSKPERNYCVTRKELLAVVKAVEHFHHYLYGQSFLVRTDHGALKWLMNFKNPEGQVARWIQRLQEYNITIEHRRGSSHRNADALSRRPCAEDCTSCSRAEAKFCQRLTVPAALTDGVVQANQGDSWSPEAIRVSQLEDRDIGHILRWKENSQTRPSWAVVSPYSPTTKAYWAQWDSLEIHNGVLYRKWENANGRLHQLQLLLPTSRVKEVLQEIHNSPTGGHFGVNKTLAKVRERFYWLKSREDVQNWCRRCDICASRKGPKTRSRGKLKIYNVGAPMERIAVDVMGPFPRTERGNRYLLVVVDYFTKWPEVYPMENQEATTVADILVDRFISRHGVPLEIHSDQGRNFEARVFQEMCGLLGMKKTRTTPLHPQSDGMVERLNRTIEQHLSLFVSEHQRDWDKYIPLFLLAYRTATHESTGNTPCMMLFGRELRLPCDILFGRPPEPPADVCDYVEDLQSRLRRIHEYAREHLQIASERMKSRYDSKATSTVFKEGDLVWLYNPHRKTGISPKLQRPWEGPYKIVQKLNDLVYRIQRGPSSKFKVVHYDRLSPYNGDRQLQ